MVLDQSTVVLLAALIGGLFAFLGGLSGIFANLWMERSRTRRERLNEVRQALIGASIQTSEVMNFIKSQRQRRWPWFWKPLQAELSHANLEKVNLRKQDLRGVLFYRTNLVEADLEYSNLQGAILSKANLRQADLHMANMRNADLESAKLERANLSNTNLSNANLRCASLKGANLESAKLQGANLNDTNLDGAKLHEVEIDHATQIAPKWLGVLEILKYGGQGRNLEGIDLQNADLTGANLEGANLRRANLLNTNLSGANLRRANLEGALCYRDGRRTNFQGADIRGAILSKGSLASSYPQLLNEAKYDQSTVWPNGYRIDNLGLILIDSERNDGKVSTGTEFHNDQIPENHESSDDAPLAPPKQHLPSER